MDQQDGYSPIPNLILEALARTYFTNYEVRILFILWRKTLGWNKKSDAISLSQFVDATGILKPNIVRTLNKLIQRGIIISGDNGKTTKYEFNMHPGVWKSLSPKITLSPKIMKSLSPEIPTISRVPTISKVPKNICPEELFAGKKLKVEPTGATDLDDVAYEVLKHLNDKAHHHYPLAPSSIIEIKKRLKAGATVEQLNTIVDYKVDEWWNNPDMRKNLNNVTLFRECHFSTYLEDAIQWKERQALSMDAFLVKPEDLKKVSLTDEQRESMKKQVYGTDLSDED